MREVRHRTYDTYVVHVSVQNKLQAMAKRLRAGKRLIARGEAAVDGVRASFYEFADNAFGPDTYVLYECRDDKPAADGLGGNRMVREMQEPREFDIEMMRLLLTPEQFADVTKTVVDVEKLDAALALNLIDHARAAEFTNYGRRPNLVWRTTGPRSEIKTEAGQIAVVAPKHVARELEG